MKISFYSIIQNSQYSSELTTCTYNIDYILLKNKMEMKLKGVSIEKSFIFQNSENGKNFQNFQKPIVAN